MPKKPLRIVIVSHALVVSVNQNRWRHLARDNNYEVHLLVPKLWETQWFGKEEKMIFNTPNVHDNNFHVHAMGTTSVKNWSRYLFRSFDAKFREIKPDLIYIIHEESVLIHHQIYLYRKFFVPKAKIIFFSMNAMGVPYKKQKNLIKRIILKWMWNNIRKNIDAVLVHYPGCIDSLRNANCNKPIFLQTQVGVDENLFSPNEKIRESYRKMLGFEDKFIIGYAGRLTIDKGVDDLVNTFIRLSKKYSNISLLLVGNGNLKSDLEKQIKDSKLENNFHITGVVDQAKVASYMNAMDTFVLGSKTMPHWIDTFPLVTVQAQATRLPVIASDSASLPWQLGDSAKIFIEGDRKGLYQHLDKFINDKDLRDEYAVKGQNRSLEKFCHNGMTINFKKIVDQVISGKFIYHEKGEKYIQWKAY